MCRGLAHLLLGLALVPPAVQAHLLKLFAAAEGTRIDGSVYYAGGSEAAGVSVIIRAPDGRVVAELRTDAEGRFTYSATERVDHLIAAETAEGHAARWVVTAGELSGDMPTPVGIAVPSMSAAGSSQPAAASDAASIPSGPLAASIERAVARQIRPLREQLRKHEERVRLRDLLGGIGYIVGIAGLVLWWRSRQGGNGG
jgi:nickel transport protein